MVPFTIGLCQVRAFDLEDAAANLENLLRAIDEAAAAGADLIALPECAYPAYYLRGRDPYGVAGVPSFAEARDAFAARARQHGRWLAAGMAVLHADGTLTNSGVVFGPDGEIRGRYDKSFLWHFDSHWFRRGASFPVFDTGFCRFGILICADSRIPEVARSLVVNGAELILDLTAWVSSGREMSELSTTQCEYLMPARAFENAAWVAAADKWGTEDGSIVYAGRSCVIDPAGAIRAIAPSDAETVLTYRIEPSAVELPVARRPALYGPLVHSASELPALLQEELPVAPREGGRVAVVPGAETLDLAAIASRFARLRAQKADLVVFGGVRGPEGWEAGLPVLEEAVREHGGALAMGVATDGCIARQTALLITPGGTHEHVATHGRGIETGEAPARVVETAVGKVGLLCGDEGLVPEVARILALEGADVVAWPLFADHAMLERLVRTRGDENKLYVAAAWPGGAMVASPDGGMPARSPAGTNVAMTAGVQLAQSRNKVRAPGTNVIRDRIPEAYGALVRQDR